MTTIVKIEVAMVGTAVIAFIVLALIGRTLQTRGGVRESGSLGRTMFPIVMGLFLLFGAGLIGLALHLFVVAQGQIGNAEVGIISFLHRNETGATLGVWTFLLLGFVIAYPAMRRDTLGPTPPTIGPSTGVLRADIGQSLDQVRAASSLQLAPTREIALDNSTQTIGEDVFDFELAGGAVRFEKCRYYFISTGAKNDPAIDSMNIGISPLKKPLLQIEADEAELRRRLGADGWRPGRFVWRSDTDLMINGGKPTSGEGRYWAKGGTLLIISKRRMDSPKPGEDPDTAGEFILCIDLVPAASPSYATLEYDPDPVSRAL